MSKIIKMRVANSNLSIITPNAKIICGNEEQWAIEFEFDEAWKSHDKKVARFIYNGHYENVDFTGNICAVPVLSNTTNVMVGVYSKEGKRLATDTVVIPCELSILCTGAKSGATPYINGDSCFIRYSAYPDGSGFTEEFSEDMAYIGIATGQNAPTDKSGYDWVLVNRADLNKRLTNIEKGYSEDFFVTGDMGFVESRTVPENALPYAEVKKIYAVGGNDNGVIFPRKIAKVESCKPTEIENLDLTLDLSEMVDDMTVEKLADGSFKFNGYTSFQGNGGACKFATVTLPKGSYGINYKHISGDGSPTITANGVAITTSVERDYGMIRAYEDNTTVTFYIDNEGTIGYLTDLIISFEICEGDIPDYWFEPAMVPFATLEIPEEIYDIDWGSELATNYIDLEKRVLVVVRRFINGASVLLDKPEEIDISDYLGVDNFIEVVPNGIIRVIRDTGEILNNKSEIVFMVKGVS